MTRRSHSGRTAPGPYAAGALTAAADSYELALTETCRIGALTRTQNAAPPYDTTTTFTATASGIACTLEPMDDRAVHVVGDPSRSAEFDLRVPHGTALTKDITVEVTAGRNTGLRLRVVEVHESSTEPLLRATCERITSGEG